MNKDPSIARVQCPQCTAMFRMKSASLGRSVKCPKCSTAFKATASTDQPATRSRSAGSAVAGTSSPAAATGKPSASPKPVTPPGMVRCEMCHQMVPKADYAAHRRSHEGTRDDGQLNEYPTLPPEERFEGDLSNVPRHYLHPKGGVVTEMPEEIIRTYLVNPFFYGYKSFCAGCGTHIRSGELVWQSTGQDLMTYTRELQATNPDSGKYRAGVWKTIIGVALFGGITLAVVAAGITYFVASMTVAAIAFGVTAVLGTAILTMLLIKMRGGI